MRVSLEPVGQSPVQFDASPARSVLVSAMAAGVRHRHDCGGKAQCGTCRVRVLSGMASPPDDRELRRLSAAGAGPDERLACQMRPGTDLVLKAVLPLTPPHPSGNGPRRDE